MEDTGKPRFKFQPSLWKLIMDVTPVNATVQTGMLGATPSARARSPPVAGGGRHGRHGLQPPEGEGPVGRPGKTRPLV